VHSLGADIVSLPHPQKVEPASGSAGTVSEAKVALEGFVCNHKFVVKKSISEIGDPSIFKAAVSVHSVL